MNFPKQNKKRNVAILYEVLIKHISKCLVENNQQEAQKALEISKKYFSEGSPLRNELKLFQSVLSTKGVSREAVNKIVEYACKSAALMNNRILDEQKSKLIKDINYSLNKKVYDHKIPDYTNYASLQLLFSESRNKKHKLDEITKIKVQDVLVERLLQKKVTENKDTKLNPQINNTVYRMLLKKFNEKYEHKLTENQKKLLMQYTISLLSEDKRGFNDFLAAENKKILSSLTEIKDKKILADKDLMSKLTECKDKYQKEVLGSRDEQKIVLGMMEYVKLVDELLSNE